MKAYLGLGSNLGDRQAYLTTALTYLEEQVVISKTSSTIETKPLGLTNQPDFLNMVCEIETNLQPHKLLELCLAIEAKMGRVREIKWGPRNIDIDILLYEDMIIKEKDLQIPHQYLTERAFVLIPLNELCSNLVHPITGKTMWDHLQILKEKEMKK